MKQTLFFFVFLIRFSDSLWFRIKLSLLSPQLSRTQMAECLCVSLLLFCVSHTPKADFCWLKRQAHLRALTRCMCDLYPSTQQLLCGFAACAAGLGTWNCWCDAQICHISVTKVSHSCARLYFLFLSEFFKMVFQAYKKLFYPYKKKSILSILIYCIIIYITLYFLFFCYFI